MQEYTEKVKERSTFRVTCAWKDSDGNAVTPDSATWTLTEEDGTIINSREDVAIATPATTNNIILSGADLAYTGNGKRILTTEAVYDSSYGTDLPLKDEYIFYIENLVNV